VNAPLHPIDHVAGVGLEQKFQLGTQAGDALLQPRRFVDALQLLHLRFKALEGGAHGHVKIAGGFKEFLAAGEGLAAVACHGQPGKEHAGALAELLSDAWYAAGALLAA
jgi:hypothetical protein